ncbi:hypothetical protein EGW08_002299 [Elysia chlorotica]|uniref:SMB domain-containing protein n=1 Tax=Elysia chlorotica TaxID=188477 RepID=A0A3S1BJS9_ELYCH|nr:hypothetical protein EGW08_002299 [Elysia chlorotica]
MEKLVLIWLGIALVTLLAHAKDEQVPITLAGKKRGDILSDNTSFGATPPTHQSGDSLFVNISAEATPPTHQSGDTLFVDISDEAPPPTQQYDMSSPTSIQTLSLMDECLEILTAYAYTKNLCSAPDIHSYLEVAKSTYTCAGRCGDAPRPGHGGRLACACDANCLVFGDCCGDMESVCPETFARSEDVNASLQGAHTSCQGGKYTPLLESTRGIEDTLVLGTTRGLYSSTTRMSTPVANLSEQDVWNLDAKAGVALKEIMRYHLKVADVKFGILFESYTDFMSWNIPLERLRFVPGVFILRCPKNRLNNDGLERTATLLSVCYLFKTRQVETPFSRQCEDNQRVTCPCDNRSVVVTNTLRNTCRGENGSASLVHRPGLPTCTNDSSPPPHNNFDNDPDNYHMIVRPVNFIPSSFRLQPTNKQADAFFGLRNKEIGNYGGDATAQASALAEDSTGYVVDQMDAFEKRTFCRDFGAFPSDCQVLECAYGSLLAHAPDSEWQIGGQACILPTEALVEVPGMEPASWMCTCFRLMTALAETPENHEDLERAWFLRPELLLSTTTGGVSGDSGLSSVSGVKLRLQAQMSSTQSSCPREYVHTARVCFRYSETGAILAPPTHSVCVSLATAPTPHSSLLNDGADTQRGVRAVHALLFVALVYAILRV